MRGANDRPLNLEKTFLEGTRLSESWMKVFPAQQIVRSHDGLQLNPPDISNYLCLHWPSFQLRSARPVGQRSVLYANREWKFATPSHKPSCHRLRLMLACHCQFILHFAFHVRCKIVGHFPTKDIVPAVAGITRVWVFRPWRRPTKAGKSDSKRSVTHHSHAPLFRQLRHLPQMFFQVFNNPNYTPMPLSHRSNTNERKKTLFCSIQCHSNPARNLGDNRRG